MSILDFDINGWVRKYMRVTKQEIVIRVNPNKLAYYITMWARIMVTHAMFYDGLVGSVVLYPLGIPLFFGNKSHMIAQVVTNASAMGFIHLNIPS